MSCGSPDLGRKRQCGRFPALAIINELRARAAMRSMSRFDLDVLYARAKAKLWSKVERLRLLEREGPLKVSDSGTRRRHGFLWQRWCVEALQEGLGVHRSLATRSCSLYVLPTPGPN